MFLCRFALRVQVRYVMKEALLVCIFLLSVVSTPFLNVFTSPTARQFMTKAKAKSEIPLSSSRIDRDVSCHVALFFPTAATYTNKVDTSFNFTFPTPSEDNIIMGLINFCYSHK